RRSTPRWRRTHAPGRFLPAHLLHPGPLHVPLHLSRGAEQHEGHDPRDPVTQRQRKIFSATAKLTAPQPATIASGAPSRSTPVPSIITARSASFSAVRGRAFTTGCIAAG